MAKIVTFEHWISVVQFYESIKIDFIKKLINIQITFKKKFSQLFSFIFI